MFDLPDLIQRHLALLERFFDTEIRGESRDFITPGLQYQFATGGKRLRPALCLISCDVLGGEPRSALSFAMASEILHNFLLVHDDIEDGDTMRRDQKTLWAEFGVPNALNVADYMIAQAYRLILEGPAYHPPGEIPALPGDVRLELARVFTYALERTVEGQALDINWRGDEAVDLERYYRLVTLKTGYYLALPWVGGAIVAGKAEGCLDQLWELGKCLGPAFQIRDDIIDLTEGKGRGGEIGCDILEGKPSFFFAHVLESEKGTADERARLLEVVRAPRERTSPEDVRWVIDLYRREGALDHAQEEAQRLAARSEEVLEELPFDDRGKSGFREIIRFVVKRKF